MRKVGLSRWNETAPGEPFQDDFTENRGPTPSEQEDSAEREHLDPDVDSQAGDRAMEDNVFGVNDAK